MTNTQRLGRFRWAVLAFLALASWKLTAYAAIAGEVMLDNISYFDPEFQIPPAKSVFAPRLKQLWLEAYARPESELKRQAADAIARAKQLGMADLSDVVPPLQAALDADDVHPLVALSTARALIILDARSAAPTLMKQMTTGSLAMAQMVTPALVRWNSPGIKEALRSQLNKSSAARERSVLAIRGLTELEDAESVGRIRELALDTSGSAKVRLEAALALGRLTSEGLADDALQLAANQTSAGRIDRLVAARMLAGHAGQPAIPVLTKLGEDPEPAVAVIALARLLKTDPDLLLPSLEKILASHDPHVRAVAVGALRARPTSERVQTLVGLFNDPSPHVRNEAREALFALAADPEYDGQIRELAMRALGTKNWRELEQAAYLLGALDHKPANQLLIELLNFERPEPFVAAAWSVKKLAVEESLPDVLKAARNRTFFLKSKKSKPFRDRVDAQVCQLFQLFGQLKYAPAESLLRQYIPRGGLFGFESRATAIWAIGHIRVDDPDPGLSAAFAKRLDDVFSQIPEEPRVRRMAAVSLGRMKADSADSMEKLKTYYQQGATINRDVGYGCAWAIRRITNEDLPDPSTPEELQQGWFLEPIDETDGDLQAAGGLR